MSQVPDEFRDRLRRGILTMLVSPDLDQRYRRERGAWLFPIVQLVRDAYGSEQARARLFSPSAHDLSDADVIGDWLAWLRREHGQRLLTLLHVWALGMPTWAIAERQHVHPRTVRYRLERALVLLFTHATGEPAPSVPEALELDDDMLALGHGLYENTGRGTFDLADEPAPGKVWAGDHWRINGKRWNDGQ